VYKARLIYRIVRLISLHFYSKMADFEAFKVFLSSDWLGQKIWATVMSLTCMHVHVYLDLDGNAYVV
jgi:hypothetical protein